MAIGLIFLAAGLPKFSRHDVWLGLFQHWRVPLPALSVYAVGGFEIVAGVLLVLGVGSTFVAALFVVDMVGAVTFAGTKDGGTFIVEPALLGIGCLIIALFGAGAWQLRPVPTLLQLPKRSRANRSNAGGHHGG